MSIFGTVILLLVAFLGALLVAPYIDRRGKTPEVNLTRWVALVYIVLAAGGMVYRLLFIAMAPELQITMPVTEFWPKLPDNASIDGPTAQVVSGGVTQADVLVQGLTPSVRWLLGTAALLQGIVAIVVGAAVLNMCNGYLKRAAFRPALAKWFTVTAVVVVVCGLGWQILEDLAGYEASRQVLAHTAGMWDRNDTGREDLTDIFGAVMPAPFEIRVDFWPVFAGLGLFTTAQIFKRGFEMQKDTVGLV